MMDSPTGSSVLASSRSFGTTSTGESLSCITLENQSGIQLELINLGARIHRLKTPDRFGNCKDIVLYCDTAADYERQNAFLGATIGRYANRIANAEFQLDDRVYSLDCNEPPNHLHGGGHGFDTRVWNSRLINTADSCAAEFTLYSADGDQGYPGFLEVCVLYELKNSQELHIRYSAETDAPTVVSLTNHAYFNLSGNLFSGLEGHWLQIFSDEFTRCSNSIPDGSVQTVAGTVMDFRQAKSITPIVEALPELLQETRGIDHNYVFGNDGLRHQVAMLSHPDSGRTLSVFSNQPAAQVYTANFLEQCDVLGPGGRPYPNQTAICIEPQHYPNAPNLPAFPSPFLRPGEKYLHNLEFHFGLTS